jgi:RimJ/RimL family protein N-acetyltransferase
LTWRPHTSVAESAAHLERCNAAWERGTEFVWSLEASETGRLLGSVASRHSGHRINLGYLLARDAWGQGYMTEALRPIIAWWLTGPGIERIWATCDVDNKASARVLEKSGFALEGVLRRWERHPNISAEARDALCYSKVRE